MSKYFFLPVNTGYYHDGNPTRECIEFYKARSNPQTHCVVVGNAVTLNGFKTNDSTGKISRHKMWTKLASEIKQGGSKPGIQLSSAWSGYVGQRTFVNKTWDTHYKNIQQEIQVNSLIDICSDFSDSIRCAIQSGFEHIQIHAAHGYLFSCLIDPNIYPHSKDAIGALAELAEIINKSAESSVRISTFCGLEHSLEETRMTALKSLISTNFNFFDLSEGYYNHNKHYIYPTTNIEQQYRLERSLAISKKFPAKQFIISGHALLPLTPFDNVSLGYCRSIIANPTYVEDKINMCEMCHTCHYHSNGKRTLTCKKWQTT